MSIGQATGRTEALWIESVANPSTKQDLWVITLLYPLEGPRSAARNCRPYFRFHSVPDVQRRVTKSGELGMEQGRVLMWGTWTQAHKGLFKPYQEKSPDYSRSSHWSVPTILSLREARISTDPVCRCIGSKKETASRKVSSVLLDGSNYKSTQGLPQTWPDCLTYKRPRWGGP